jgi:hypothetical protein
LVRYSGSIKMEANTGSCTPSHSVNGRPEDLSKALRGSFMEPPNEVGQVSPAMSSSSTRRDVATRFVCLCGLDGGFAKKTLLVWLRWRALRDNPVWGSHKIRHGIQFQHDGTINRVLHSFNDEAVGLNLMAKLVEGLATVGFTGRRLMCAAPLDSWPRSSGKEGRHRFFRVAPIYPGGVRRWSACWITWKQATAVFTGYDSQRR